MNLKLTLVTAAVASCFAGGAYATIHGTVTQDGRTVEPVVTEKGEIWFGTPEVSTLRIESSSGYGLMAGYKDGLYLSESVRVFGETISVQGYKAAKGAVWVRGESAKNIESQIVLGNEATRVVSVRNDCENGEGLSALGQGQGFLEVNAKEEVLITALKGNGIGIRAQRSTETNPPPEDRASIVINSPKTDIRASYVGILNISNGEVVVNGGLEVHAPVAMEVRGHSDTVINPEGTGDVRIFGDIRFATPGGNNASGNIIDADLNLRMTTPDSVWVGGLYAAYPEENKDSNEFTTVTGMNLELSNGAQWTPTMLVQPEGDAKKLTIAGTAVNHLTFEGGRINLTQEIVGTEAGELVIENLTGSGGTVNLAADLSAEADLRTAKLTVENAASSVKLDVNLMNADLSAELTADELTPEVAKELLGNVAGADAQVTTDVREGLTTPGFGIDGEGTVHVAEANSLMVSTLELASAAPLALNRILTNDLRKRMGDLRTDANAHGAWARYDGGRLSGDAGLKNDFHTVQVGVDTVPVPGAARFGLAFSYTESDAEYARGDADMTAFGLSAYGTWMNASGFFADVVGRIASADTDLNVDGEHKGAMDNTALSLSAEVGQRWDLARGLFLEPQAEVAFTYVDDERFEVGPASYALDAVESLTGRIGLAAGWTCPEDFGNVYARVSVVHEFLGDAEIKGVNGRATGTYGIDGKDTWVEYGIGANLNLTKSAYLWADLERTGGAVLDEDWRATVGVRYGW